MKRILQHLPRDAHILVNTKGAQHEDAYRVVEFMHTPTVVVAARHSAMNMKRSLEQQQVPTGHLHFIDTVAKRANADVPLENCTYLLTPQLTELGSTILQHAASLPGRKWMLFDSLSSLRHGYSQATINQFLALLMPRLHMYKTNGIFLNEERLPVIPNVTFDRVIEL